MIEAMLALSVATASPDTLWMGLEARIGEETGVLLEQVEAVEVDSLGTVYLVDGFAHVVRSYAWNGSLRWTVGGEGEGPGEFAAPVGLAWAPDGALWIMDPENQRATVVDAQGQVVDTRRVPSSFTLSPWPGRFDSRGNLHHYLDAPEGSYDYRMGVYDRALELVEVRTPPPPPEPELYFEGRTARGSHMRARIPYTPRFIWRLDGEGRFVSTWTGDLHFRREADPSAVLAIPAAPVPRVTPAEREEALEGLDRFRRLGGRIEPDRIPDRKPPLATFVLDDRDRIWAVRSATAGSTSTVFEVLAPDGQHLATVAVPVRLAGHPTPVVRAGWLVGVEVDALGRQTVVLARVPGGLHQIEGGGT